MRCRPTALVTVLVILPVAVLSILLHRHGHSWGDDFSLYLRQSKSLLDGNIGQVVADNHVIVDIAAKPGFSPYVYPWTFPVLMAPFIRLFGLDVDRLKLVEVACFCGFLACWFGILRRRLALWLALATTASVGYSLVYMRHTDALLSELPYMFAVAGTLWWIDRWRRPDTTGPAVAWEAIDRRHLMWTGLLMMLVFNTRREGIAIMPAVMAMQAVDVWPRRRHGVAWRALAAPHVWFIGSVLTVQLLLPSALAPDYEGAGPSQLWRKLHSTFPGSFTNQLGFDHLSTVALVAIAMAIVIGVAVRMHRNAAEDIGLTVFAVGSMVVVGLIPYDSSRYTLALTPFAVYFVVQAAASIPRTRHVAGGAVAATLLVAAFVDIPGAVGDARDFANTGVAVQGPDQQMSQEMFEAVRTYTHHDDLVAFFKARAMVFYTGRVGVQSKDLAIILQRADWFVMGHRPPVGIPVLTDRAAAAAGLVGVWSNDEWTLWRVPAPDDAKLGE